MLIDSTYYFAVNNPRYGNTYIVKGEKWDMESTKNAVNLNYTYAEAKEIFKCLTEVRKNIGEINIGRYSLLLKLYIFFGDTFETGKATKL